MRDNMGMYRGKLVDGNGWIYGNLLDDNCTKKTYYILSQDAGNFDEFEEVIPETVGQFNPVINNYEGDIIYCKNRNLKGTIIKNELENWDILWDTDDGNYCDWDFDEYAYDQSADFITIGNIHTEA